MNKNYIISMIILVVCGCTRGSVLDIFVFYVLNAGKFMCVEEGHCPLKCVGLLGISGTEKCIDKLLCLYLSFIGGNNLKR